ncbi:hypothetical protein [Bacillus sp. UMB0893]|uniref:hypothetical protein n=1 Tax=Bacillus sp. UMB0893 TaxID=2066053 RepID=UPI000C759F59|nr:hypothetical protein [Bacillus sp. UMB0893]PLR67078.1 hypothetical protein CYJ36_13910 [Bacillus sp. UMB0893]
MDLIKIEDIQNLKEGDAYFINVDEERRPQILEALKNLNAEEATDGDVIAEQVTIPSCGPEICNPLVPFCITASRPNLPGGLTAGGFFFAFDSSCVQCVIEPCLLPNAIVENPCLGEPPITGCEVAVNRVRAVGCIRGFLSPIFIPSCGGGFGVANNEETFCVNNVICFTCNENPCPDFCNTIGVVFTAIIESGSPCGNSQLSVVGNFVLPSCV